MINGDVNSGDIRLAKLSRTENDQSTSWISGTVIDEDASTDAIAGVNSNYNTEVNTIVVLPEKIARAVKVDTLMTHGLRRMSSSLPKSGSTALFTA